MQVKLSLREYLKIPSTYLALVTWVLGVYIIYHFLQDNFLLYLVVVVPYVMTVDWFFSRRIKDRALHRLVDSIIPAVKRKGKDAKCPYCDTHNVRKQPDKTKIVSCDVCGRVFKVVVKK